MDRFPVLVKSVFSAPVPEYALLTTFALSAQTWVSPPNKECVGLLFLNMLSKSGNISTRSVSLKIPASTSCFVMTCLAKVD